MKHVNAAVLGLFVVALAMFAQARQTASVRAEFTVVETGIPELQAAMKAGRITSRELVIQYLTRIATYEHTLHAALAVNPNAIREAEQLDRERVQGHIRGPLHGIPIAVKDNIQTTNMPTTGGMLAFAGYVPPYEATIVQNLKAAGAIIIAKTGLTELAYWVAGPPTPIPGDYNAVGGFGYNPYDPRIDPRPHISAGSPVLSPGGSRSGIGTAASFWTANVGSDTGGSIISPANQMMQVGLRPTVGRISRYGIIPLTADHDTAGPMARSVTDAAILLGALESASPDPKDDATRMCTPPANRDYTRFLQADALKGKRIGIPRAYFYEPVTVSNRRYSAGGPNGLNETAVKLMNDAISMLKQKGAVIVDPANLPSLVDADPEKNFAVWGDYCAGATQGKGSDASCSVNFKYGFKRDFNRWLESLGSSAPVKSLTELREWNLSHAKGGSIKYGQSRLDLSDEMDVEKDESRNSSDNARDILLSRTNGIEAVLKTYNLDAIVTPRAQVPRWPHAPITRLSTYRSASCPALPQVRNRFQKGLYRNQLRSGSISSAPPAANPNCWAWVMHLNRPVIGGFTPPNFP